VTVYIVTDDSALTVPRRQ